LHLFYGPKGKDAPLSTTPSDFRRVKHEKTYRGGGGGEGHKPDSQRYKKCPKRQTKRGKKEDQEQPFLHWSQEKRGLAMTTYELGGRLQGVKEKREGKRLQSLLTIFRQIRKGKEGSGHDDFSQWRQKKKMAMPGGVKKGEKVNLLSCQ